jgi:hypothetical protein
MTILFLSGRVFRGLFALTCLFSLTAAESLAQPKKSATPALVLAVHCTAHEAAKASASSGDFAVATALQYLAEANRRTNDPDIKANLQALTGFLQERYLGDPESAKAAYRAAAQLAPGNESVREKVERLEHTQAETHAKAHQNP